MTTILITEQASSGHVYTRRFGGCQFSQREMDELSKSSLKEFSMHPNLTTQNCRMFEYSPNPGTFSAIGCWSLVGDARAK